MPLIHLISSPLSFNSNSKTFLNSVHIFPAFSSLLHHDPYSHLRTFLLTVFQPNVFSANLPHMTGSFLTFRFNPSGLLQKGFQLLSKIAIQFQCFSALLNAYYTVRQAHFFIFSFSSHSINLIGERIFFFYLVYCSFSLTELNAWYIFSTKCKFAK